MERPQNLNPCGHSLDQCSASAVSICPLCRKGKASVTDNFSLKSAIESYITHKEKKYADEKKKEKEEAALRLHDESKESDVREERERERENSIVDSHVIDMPASSARLFKFHVHQQNQDFEYALAPNSRVSDVRSLHSSRMNLPVARIGLFQDNRLLSDARLLREINDSVDHPIEAKTLMGPLQISG